MDPGTLAYNALESHILANSASNRDAIRLSTLETAHCIPVIVWKTLGKFALCAFVLCSEFIQNSAVLVYLIIDCTKVQHDLRVSCQMESPGGPCVYYTTSSFCMIPPSLSSMKSGSGTGDEE